MIRSLRIRICVSYPFHVRLALLFFGVWGKGRHLERFAQLEGILARTAWQETCHPTLVDKLSLVTAYACHIYRITMLYIVHLNITYILPPSSGPLPALHRRFVMQAQFDYASGAGTVPPLRRPGAVVFAAGFHHQEPERVRYALLEHHD